MKSDKNLKAFTPVKQFVFDRPTHLVGIGDVDGGHVEARLVETRPLTQLLYDLHHHALKDKHEAVRTRVVTGRGESGIPAPGS